jgi:hypothetical protein
MSTKIRLPGANPTNIFCNIMVRQIGILSNPFFLHSFAGQRVLNKAPTVWLEGARPTLLVLLALPLPKNEFGILII